MTATGRTVGSRLVALAVTNALPNLGTDDRARVALLVMALTAHDTDHTPTYFAGWQPLAKAMGFSPDDTSGRRAVERAITRLRHLGYVRQSPEAPRSHKRRWQLNLLPQERAP